MPPVMVTRKIVDTEGPLPIKKSFVLSSDAPCALFVSGSVFSKSNLNKLSIDVTVDGKSIGRPMIFADEKTHMALVPMTFSVVLSSGDHVIGLAAVGGTASDSNDTFTATLMYVREVNRRAVKSPRKRS